MKTFKSYLQEKQQIIITKNKQHKTYISADNEKNTREKVTSTNIKGDLKSIADIFFGDAKTKEDVKQAFEKYFAKKLSITGDVKLPKLDDKITLQDVTLYDDKGSFNENNIFGIKKTAMSYDNYTDKHKTLIDIKGDLDLTDAIQATDASAIQKELQKYIKPSQFKFDVNKGKTKEDTQE